MTSQTTKTVQTLDEAINGTGRVSDWCGHHWSIQNTIVVVVIIMIIKPIFNNKRSIFKIDLLFNNYESLNLPFD